MVVGPMGEVIFTNMYDPSPYIISGTPFYTAWCDPEFLWDFTESSFKSYNTWYDMNPNVKAEETITYSNLWADCSNNVHGIGKDAKGQGVSMFNGNFSPTNVTNHCIYASDIYGITHVLADDANFYTLDASGQTVNAFATNLPPANIKQDIMKITLDGRVLIVDPSAGALYQYTLTGTMLALDSIGDASFKPAALGTRPDGSIILADNNANVRLYPQVPLPAGFTPVATPTTTNSFTPTSTFTLTITPTPTITCTYTPRVPRPRPQRYPQLTLGPRPSQTPLPPPVPIRPPLPRQSHRPIAGTPTPTRFGCRPQPMPAFCPGPVRAWPFTTTLCG